jgi:lipoprotein
VPYLFGRESKSLISLYFIIGIGCPIGSKSMNIE